MKYIQPVTSLSGTVTVPGDKSISHRSVMFGAISKGRTEIDGFLNGADCLSTISCFRNMGVQIEQSGTHVVVHGRGMRALIPPEQILDVGNSGTTTRLISGILAGQSFSSVLSGDASLNSRPMKRIMDPLTRMGAQIESINQNGCAPLRIAPGTLHGIHYTSPVASAQVKSCILLAGLYADGKTSVTEPFLSRNHTELLLTSFGADISSETDIVTGAATASIRPCDELYGQKLMIPGDISSAAYFIAAALLIPGSELLLKNVGINPTRAGILQVCQNMGAEIIYQNQSLEGEPTADLLIRHQKLHGTIIEGSLIPTLIDEIPMIAVMAAMAEGETIIRDAKELKVKETDRILTVTENLRAMGADITPTEDGMVIRGTGHLHGAVINSYLDHRIAMAFAVAGLTADGTTQIQGSECVTVSYPAFFETLTGLCRS